MPQTNPAPLIIESNEPAPDFHPAAGDACFCGSGKPFGDCCGSTQATRPPPYGLFMFENYIDAELARDLTAFANQRNGRRLMVIDNKESTPDNIVKVEDKRRVAERVDLGERRQEVNNIVKSAFIDLAGKCFSKTLDWFESPELMRYREGGFYLRHADSQNMNLETSAWSKVIDRDLSMVIYLNDGYEGGELSFYRLNYQIRPRAGAVVLFPSDHRFLHQAEPVKKGVRYAIVSWASVKGIAKVAQKPPECAIFID
jgi:predicted 2-oxoglutarate/Fe(II)-dependent dioxygenase YbiX